METAEMFYNTDHASKKWQYTSLSNSGNLCLLFFYNFAHTSYQILVKISNLVYIVCTSIAVSMVTTLNFATFNHS